MTVNRTTLLDLPLPVSGTESGTWGDTTNNGLTQYMDIAIAGMSNLTSANFTAGALTIETTEGTSSATNITATSAQYAGFRVTSLATNSTITVGNTGTSPARSYRLINADSTYTLTFKATGQTGVTLQPGQSAVVAFNGTDYVFIGAVGPGSSLNTPLAVVGNATAGAEIRLPEDTDNGSNYVALKAPDTLASNLTFTLPSTDGTNGQVITTNGSGTLSFTTAASGNVTTSGNNAFVGANTFYNATGQTFAQASTNDGIILQGRAGGSSSYRVTFTTGTLSASRTVTLPNADINFTTGLDVANGGTGATTLTANNVILGNGTSAVQFVAPGSNGNVLTSNGTTWTSSAISGFVTASANNAFTGANTFYNATGQTFGTATAAQDGIILAGRAGGTSTYRVTLQPTTLSASRTVTLPDANTTIPVATQVITFSGPTTARTYTLPDASVTLLSTNAAVTVPQGGTGATTLTGVLKGNGTSAFSAATAGTDYVAPATATTFTALQTFSGSTSVAATKLTNAKEVATISATAATGTINYDVTTQSVLYYTSNASANWTVNFRGSSGTSLDTLMSTGESITVAFLVTQGSTAYYNSEVRVDGSLVTPKYQGGTAWSAGNASSIDAYVYTIVKTGSAAFTVFASQTRFA